MISTEFPTILFTILNILVLLIALRLILFKPVHKILEQRQAEADADKIETEKSKAEAQAVKEQYENALGDVEKTKAEIVSEARGKASVEYDRIVAEANGKAEEIIENAKKDAQSEKQKILDSVHSELTSVVMEATAKAMAGTQSTEGDQALYDQFINKLGK